MLLLEDNYAYFSRLLHNYNRNTSQSIRIESPGEKSYSYTSILEKNACSHKMYVGQQSGA